MGTVSLCMIVRNEEDVLARCLESMRDLVEEIIVVDTGSTDNTKKIAIACGAKLYEFDWIDDFAAARNYAFAQGSMEYCMWLDADDVLLPEDKEQFILTKEQLLPEDQVVMMRYHTAFDEAGAPCFSYYRERLIRRGCGMVWKGAVHEAITPIGKVIYSDCAVSHKKEHPTDPNRNLLIFEKQIAAGIALEPRAQFYYGRELYYHGRYPQAAAVFADFLQQEQGWLENKLECCRHLSLCYNAMGEPHKALTALLQSLAYDLPRAELCCEIGRHFFETEQYEKAIFWYRLALTCARDDSRGGFVLPDCYGYIPCIQLCVCFARMGNIKKAIAYNKLAGQIKPKDAAVAHNCAYFAAVTQ